MVGDIYETIALVTFGNLVMGVLKKKIDKMKKVFETATQDMKDGDEMKEYINRLVDSMKTLTVAGVSSSPCHACAGSVHFDHHNLRI